MKQPALQWRLEHCPPHSLLLIVHHKKRRWNLQRNMTFIEDGTACFLSGSAMYSRNISSNTSSLSSTPRQSELVHRFTSGTYLPTCNKIPAQLPYVLFNGKQADAGLLVHQGGARCQRQGLSLTEPSTSRADLQAQVVHVCTAVLLSPLDKHLSGRGLQRAVQHENALIALPAFKGLSSSKVWSG